MQKVHQRAILAGDTSRLLCHLTRGWGEINAGDNLPKSLRMIGPDQQHGCLRLARQFTGN